MDEDVRVGVSSGTSMPPPLSPSDSVMSIGAFRPSLVWLFNRIRREDRDYLTKEDLQQLLGAKVDSTQLDEAFENLDLDKDGEISLDEFIAGFAKFWKEAPHTPGYDPVQSFNFPPEPQVEEHYESGDCVPSDKLKECLSALPSHNRHSIEHLWQSLNNSNPELLTDFEDFVAEVASEVQVAQRALDNQRLAIKREVSELDEEMESRLNDAQTTLHIKTNLVKQQVRAKLEKRLAEKEGELMMVRGQLDELEEEVMDTQRLHTELKDQIEELHQEKVELNERLLESEKKLQETQSTVTVIQSKALTEVEVQQQHLQRHEDELLKQKRDYEESIAKLKEQLAAYTQLPPEPQFPSNQATPDLLATAQPRPPSGDTLRDEIVQKEGMASPLLRREQVLEPSPFRQRTRSFVRKRPEKSQPEKEGRGLKKRSSLTMSLPNLADIDDLGNVASSRQPIYIPVYVGSEANKGSKLDTHPDEELVSPVQIHVTPTEDDVSLTEYHMTPTEDHVTPTEDHVTPIEDHVIPTEDLVTPSEDHLTTVSGRRESVDSDTSSLPSVPDHPLQSLREQEWISRCQPIEFLPVLTNTPDYTFKILVVGDSYVGKSSYIHRLCNNNFSQCYTTTIGVDFQTKALRTEDKKIVSLQLWDTAGQERYQSVTRAYYRGAQGVILMYDISQEQSFLSVKYWITTIHDNTEGSPPAAMILVGNKVDLEEVGHREVLTDTGENFAKMYGADFIETSAKTGYNVANSLLMLVRAIKDRFDEKNKSPKDGKNIEQFQVQDRTTIQLDSKKDSKSESSCICSR